MAVIPSVRFRSGLWRGYRAAKGQTIGPTPNECCLRGRFVVHHSSISGAQTRTLCMAPREIVSIKWRATGIGSYCRYRDIAFIETESMETAMSHSQSTAETTIFWFLLTLVLMVPWLLLD